jgi:hypothetical protein
MFLSENNASPPTPLVALKDYKIYPVLIFSGPLFALVNLSFSIPLLLTQRIQRKFAAICHTRFIQIIQYRYNMIPEKLNLQTAYLTPLVRCFIFNKYF